MIKLVIACVFIFINSNNCYAADLIENDNGYFRAELQNVSLSEVIKFFENEHGIKFIGDDLILQSNVTVFFYNLTMEEALKRILSKTNFVFTYDSQNQISEVRLLQSSQKIYTKQATTPPPNNSNQLLSGQDMRSDQPNISTADNIERRDEAETEITTESSQEIEVIKDDINSFQATPVESLGGMPNPSEDEITNFQIVPNAPPPGQ